MGIRVDYWEIPMGNIREAVERDYETLRVWYNQWGEEYPNEIDYDTLEVFISNDEPSLLFESLFVDKLISVYLSEFCDFGPGRLRGIKGTSSLYLSNYEKAQIIIREKCSLSLQQYWSGNN